MRIRNSHGLQESCGEKGGHSCSLKRERGPRPPTWTGFYCFSRYITSRMVFIYYAQVHFRWLPFTENQGEDVANYIKKRRIFANVKGKVVELFTLHTGEILGQILGSYFKYMH